MRAKRIFGAKLDELQDPLMEEDHVLRTPLQNALIVSFRYHFSPPLTR